MIEDLFKIYRKYFRNTKLKKNIANNLSSEEKKKRFTRAVRRRIGLNIYEEKQFDKIIDILNDFIQVKSGRRIGASYSTLSLALLSSLLAWMFRTEEGAFIAVLIIALIFYVMFLSIALKIAFSEHSSLRMAEDIRILIKEVSLNHEIKHPNLQQ